MKECAYCGRENEDHAVACRECGTDSFKNDPPKESESLADSDVQEHLVTLTACENLMGADLLVSRLAAAGIEALIPDEFLMQNVAFNLNAYGYVRVQVRRKDYTQAVSFPVQTKTWLHLNSVKSESSAFRPEKRLKVFARNGWD